MQVWPAFWNAPHTAPLAARSRSASSQHDHRVLAAELEQHRGERVGRGRHHPLAGASRAGEHDLVDAAADQRLAGGAAAGDDLRRCRPRCRPRTARPMARPTVGVTSDGLSTTVLPANSAVMIGVMARVNG